MALVPVPVQVIMSERDLSRLFKDDMFTHKPEKHWRICLFLLPSCAQMFPDWGPAGMLVH